MLLQEWAGQTSDAKGECHSSANLILSIESGLLHPSMQTTGTDFRFATVAGRNRSDPNFRIKHSKSFYLCLTTNRRSPRITRASPEEIPSFSRFILN